MYLQVRYSPQSSTLRMSNDGLVMMLSESSGYSSLCVGLALPENGKLVALDVSVEWTNVAKKHWAEAGTSTIPSRVHRCLVLCRRREED